jgi:crossover junction endodeoxyribonuclease RuvC
VAVIVIGIDLSLTQTGLAIAQDGRIVWTGTVRTTGKKGDNLDQRTMRLRDIRNQIESAVLRYDPELAVVEAPSFGSVHGSAHDRSGLWWLVVDMLYLRSIPVAMVAPTARAKYGTGNGRSQKGAVHAEVKETYGRTDLPIKSNDEGDAVLLSAMGSRHLGLVVEEYLTDAHVAAMEKVAWP